MVSRTRGRTRYRCRNSKCYTRFPWSNKRKTDPKCPVCKSKNVRNIEGERRRELDKQNTCNCYFYPFPHRAGTLRCCVKHPLSAEPLNQDEEEDYRSCLETPRSGFC